MRVRLNVVVTFDVAGEVDQRQADWIAAEWMQELYRRNRGRDWVGRRVHGIRHIHVEEGQVGVVVAGAR